MELEPVHSSFDTFVVKKKNLVIDKRIILTDTMLKKWRQNINFQCRGMERPQTFVIPSIDLLKQPLRSQEEIRELQKTREDYTASMTMLLILHQEIRTDMDIDVTSSLEDIEILLGKIQDPSITRNQLSLSSTCSSKKSHYIPLISREILALLEVLWSNQPYAKFSDLISKNTNTEQNAYTKQDAATVFCILLSLKFVFCEAEVRHQIK
ncbi:uncharacterized protein LOC105185966 isoform X4 [Harpegnathos saltator]|uniref:uncharacterized protein LOC105185966 isoform X4 n=1 Tax=Harpegnathos saltator TaxID=610380 RepID=UPI00058B51BC|nr:uncharacterized protein LOC105185966 isoform X4 [Harpegnathos saltator]